MRILVIEDNNVARRMVKIAFEANGCIVDCASSGRDGLAKLDAQHDLILLDLGLPDIDGLEVAKLIRQKQTPEKTFFIIALTAHTEDEKKQLVMQAGIDDFMAKPLTMEKCENILKNFGMIKSFNE